MKKIKHVISFFIFFCSLAITAQQVIKTDTISGNTVTMSMDRKISDMLRSTEEKCALVIGSGSEISDTYTAPKINVPERSMSTAEVCRQNPRLMGVKILIATVKSNQEANEVGLYFRSKFPSFKVQKDASLRPNYKIMAGSYFNKESARSDFNNVKRVFKDARLVNYYIFCVEAK